MRDFTFEGLQTGSLYQFKVFARNELGVSETGSEPLSVYAATYPYVMDEPVLVSATPGGTASSLQISWTPC